MLIKEAQEYGEYTAEFNTVTDPTNIICHPQEEESEDFPTVPRNPMLETTRIS